MDILQKFATTSQILDPAAIRIELFSSPQTFDHVFAAWKKYRYEKHVMEAYGEPTDPAEDIPEYKKYVTLFDNMIDNDDAAADNTVDSTVDNTADNTVDNTVDSTVDNTTDSVVAGLEVSKIWMCIAFQNGDEVVIKRTTGKKPFVLLHCQYSRMPDCKPRNILGKRGDCTGECGSTDSKCTCEYVLSLLHM
jgi:hypothetical protein